jgi:O-acetyl-ADP-ribose deacetylase (regulator of RNase III)
MGHMGAGVAAQVAKRFPEVYTQYAFKHASEGLKLGEIQAVEVAPFKFIVNAMTQQSGGNYHPLRDRAVEYDAVADCFEKVVELQRMIADANSGRQLPIVFPQIGAGIAGGNWEIITSIIENVVPSDVEKILCIYAPTPHVGFPSIIS